MAESPDEDLGPRSYTGLSRIGKGDGPGSEVVKQCCVCMRKDRELLHLCLVNGGGNSLFSLLCDKNDETPAQAYLCTSSRFGVKARQMELHLYKGDGTSNGQGLEGCKKPTWLIICWKCDTVMSKIVRFRQQACKAQRRLSSIATECALTRNTFVLIPPISGSRASGPEAILEYRTHAHGDTSQPLLRVVRYVLPDESEPTLPAPREGASHSSLRELLMGIHH